MAVIGNPGPFYLGRLHDLNAEVEAEVQLIQHQFGPDWTELSRDEIKPPKGRPVDRAAGFGLAAVQQG